MGKHIQMRGKRYHYVCRVPSDLLHLFPSPVISKSLHTANKKHATLLGVTTDYKAKQLFTQLRTGMLDKTLEKYLINLFLHDRLETLESIATGKAVSKGATEDIAISDGLITSHETRHAVSLSDAEKQEMRGRIATMMAELGRAALTNRDAWMHEPFTEQVAAMLQNKHGIKVSKQDKTILALQFENAAKKIHEAEAGIYSGEWSLYESLREQVNTDLSQPYTLFADALQQYAKWYTADKANISLGAMKDMEVECESACNNDPPLALIGVQN